MDAQQQRTGMPPPRPPGGGGGGGDFTPILTVLFAFVAIFLMVISTNFTFLLCRLQNFVISLCSSVDIC